VVVLDFNREEKTVNITKTRPIRPFFTPQHERMSFSDIKTIGYEYNVTGNTKNNRKHEWWVIFLVDSADNRYQFAGNSEDKAFVKKFVLELHQYVFGHENPDYAPPSMESLLVGPRYR
jgi:hypothetical protein